jgi:hypothetical protein
MLRAMPARCPILYDCEREQAWTGQQGLLKALAHAQMTCIPALEGARWAKAEMASFPEDKTSTRIVL